MKFTAVASLALASCAAAQEVQSKPFKLVVSSANKGVNGKALSACHSGAGIESLCVYGSGSTYYFNTTEGSEAPVKGYTPEGTLVFNLPADPDTVSEPMSFYVDPSTNVAQAMFEPGYDVQSVSFGSQGKMVVISYLDDTKTPPTDGTAHVLDRWYMCQTEYEGYQYQTLNFLLGDGTPQNPSCVKAEITRKYT